MRVWFARASSHSSNCLEIATFEDEGNARKVRKALQAFAKRLAEAQSTDWGTDDFGVSIRGNRVIFSVYTSGDLDEVRDFLEGKGGDVTELADVTLVTFKVEKSCWREVDALVAVANLLRGRILDPTTYDSEVSERTERKGKCSYTLEAYTDEYDYEEDVLRGESVSELRQMGIEVSIE